MEYVVNENEGVLNITVEVDLQGRISEDAVALVMFNTTTETATTDGKWRHVIIVCIHERGGQKIICYFLT